MKNGNPAVVGLAGFGMTTFLLQLHNLGLIGWGPVLGMGIIFGGLAQLIAGFQEQKMGNNFGYSAFVSYGAFWIGLSIIKLLNHFNVYPSSTTDVGFYLLGWTLYTIINSWSNRHDTHNIRWLFNFYSYLPSFMFTSHSTTSS